MTKKPSKTHKPKHAIHGWLVLDKPRNMTSTQAVAKIRHHLRPQKIGHAGTLDPLATGILPIALGEATKTIPYTMRAKKEYDFTMAWGEARDTDDGEGKCIATSSIRPSRDAITASLAKFTGRIWQTPPVYSAIKQDGKRAYALARAGKPPQLSPRQVTIHALTLTAHNPSDETTRLCATTGKGVYIRALGRDIARACGSEAYISGLRRLRVGGFDSTHAIAFNTIEKLGEKLVDKTDAHALLHPYLLPLESALADMPQMALRECEVTQLRHGQAISMDGKPQLVMKPEGTIYDESSDSSEHSECIVGMYEGHAVALMRAQPHAHIAKPVRVFNPHHV
ncbi:MAG: tRNA pseudouridine(55) synthase TruB [Proteobacteria bacterium]|nr:tRNA pseudouridine(55) synthase TruB [Pseudomonadota bacterium]